MNLQQIRLRTGYNEKQVTSLKQTVRQWLGKTQFPIALTLTLKQTITEETAFGVRKRALTRRDAEKMAERFKMKLNRELFGMRGADKQGKTLKYIFVLEGEVSKKNLHLHAAIGGFADSFDYKTLPEKVLTAKRLVKNIDTQFDLQIADCDWLDYITKEITAQNTDNVLWQLA